MANVLMVSLAMALIISLANAEVGLSENTGTDMVAVPRKNELESEIYTKEVVLPVENLEFVKDSETSESKEEDQNSKSDDENDVWLEVSTDDSVVKAVHLSDYVSVPFPVVRLGHSRHHNCRHKPWFRELPGNDERLSKGKGEDVSLDSLILSVMHIEQRHSHGNLKKHHRDNEESKEEKMESSKHQEDEKLVNEEKEEVSEKEDEPKGKEIEPKPKEDLVKESTDQEQVQTWLMKRFRKFLINF